MFVFAFPVDAYTQKATLINKITGKKIVVNVGDNFPSKDWTIYNSKIIGSRTQSVTDYTSLGSSYGPLGSPMQNPINGAAATSSAGTLKSDTYYFKITSVDFAGGETEPSDELSCTVVNELLSRSTSTSCTVTFTPNIKASTTKLWISTTPGSYNSYKIATSSTLVATTTGLTTGTIPTNNTAYNDVGIGQYHSSNKTLTEGQLSNLQLDINGSLKVINFFSKAFVSSDTAVKSSSGFVHSITYSPSDAEATAGQINICDSLSLGRGTSTIYYLTAAYHEPQTIILDQYFSTGIYVDFDTTADVNVSISYK